jgi:hypothetical protein
MNKIIACHKKNNFKLFKWCVWETIENCTDRTCSRCALYQYCRGKAKQANGYLKIDDVITQMKRSSKAAFESEMLCIKPSAENLVFGDFDTGINVRTLDYNPNLPLYRSLDFGFVNPFVCLWIQTDADSNIYAIDEYIRRRATIDVHAGQIKTQTPIPEEKVTATFCDPAGAGKNDVTGTSAVKELSSLGIKVKYKKSPINEGIELIRRAILSGDGKSRLFVSPKCPRLIEALSCYHYPENSADSELPEKDGVYDHPIDALRYFFVNINHPQTQSRNY